MSEPKVMPPQRALVLSTMLSILASCAVFAILSWTILVPQIARKMAAQDAQIQTLTNKVAELQSAVEAMAAAPAPQNAAPAPAAAPAAPPPGAAGAPGATAGAPNAPAPAPSNAPAPK